MQRFAIALLMLLAAPLVRADHIYKCKAATGETIYQSDPCPAGAATVAHGSYERQPDNPSNQLQAAAEGRAAAQREYERQQADAAAPSYDEPEQQSEYARQTAAHRADVEAGSYRSRVGHSGKAKVQGYPAEQPQTISNPLNGGNPIAVPINAPATAANSPPPVAPPPVHMQPAPTPPPVITDCRGGGNHSVTCYDTAGGLHMGHTDPAGNTDVYGPTGSPTRLPNDACIKDDFGRCK